MDTNQAAKLAVENVLKEGLTDIFPPPAELKLMRSASFRNTLVNEVAKCVRGNSLESLDINPIDHVLLPKKGPFDFRRCALIQPLDTIKYLAVALTMADEIEQHRPSNRKQLVFSYRFNPSKGYLFDPRYHITQFRKTVSKRTRSKGCKFLVSCDIANFYDRMNLHRLESLLLSLDLDKIRVGQLNALLLFWANRDSYGLPVGSNASRILAEAALIDVDNYMLSVGAKFSRFVDDYRLFAPDAHTAHHWLTQLIERLWLEGLTINKAKTRIEDVSDLNTEDTSDGKTHVAEARALSASTKEVAPDKEPILGRPQFRIVAGYGGVIPTRFRAPTSEELKKFDSSDPVEILEELKGKTLPSPEDITGFVKSVVSTKRYSAFLELPEVADMFPQFTPYVVDVLCKYADDIPLRCRQGVRDKFVRRLKGKPALPEYIVIALIRLLGTVGYVSKDTLFEYFRELRRNAGAYIGRALLDALEEHVSRAEVIEIRKYFSRADSWEKREIVRIVEKHLHEDEKRPWLKNVRSQEARDLFLVEQVRQQWRG